jgi:ATP-dependent Clp protease, protease subunit
MMTPRAGGFPPQPAVPPWPPLPPERPGPYRPGPYPDRPGPYPDRPGPYREPPGPAPEPQRQNPALAPARVWFDPRGPQSLYERLLDQRIVMAHGQLDGEAATRLSAQLLTLDAEGTGPIRLELQNLDAELPAALSVMGVLDVVRGPVSGYVAGQLRGPALGILAAARHRYAYPNALFVLSEPWVRFDGSVTALAAQEEQARTMLDELFGRIAEVTGREAGEVRADAQRGRSFSVAEAIGYGLVEGRATPRALSARPGLAGPAAAPGEGGLTGTPGEGDHRGGGGGPGAGDDQPGGHGHGHREDE